MLPSLEGGEAFRPGEEEGEEEHRVSLRSLHVYEDVPLVSFALFDVVEALKLIEDTPSINNDTPINDMWLLPHWHIQYSTVKPCHSV